MIISYHYLIIMIEIDCVNVVFFYIFLIICGTVYCLNWAF